MPTIEKNYNYLCSDTDQVERDLFSFHPDLKSRHYLTEEIAKGGENIVFALKPLDKEAPPVIMKKNIARGEKQERINAIEATLAADPHPCFIKRYHTPLSSHEDYQDYQFVECAQRGSLERNIFSPFDARRLFFALAHGVSHLHSHHIVHRDLKLENILLGDDGLPKIIDFGISQIVDESGLVIFNEGSPAMAPPEFFTPLYPEKQGKAKFLQENGKPKQVDGMAWDIWCLGNILYRLHSGGRCPLHYERVSQHAYDSQVFEKIDFSDEVFFGGEHDASLKELIAKMMSKKPEDRPNIETVLAHPYFAGLSKSTMHEDPDYWVQSQLNLQNKTRPLELFTQNLHDLETKYGYKEEEREDARTKVEKNTQAFQAYLEDRHQARLNSLKHIEHKVFNVLHEKLHHRSMEFQQHFTDIILNKIKDLPLDVLESEWLKSFVSAVITEYLNDPFVSKKDFRFPPKMVNKIHDIIDAQIYENMLPLESQHTKVLTASIALEDLQEKITQAIHDYTHPAKYSWAWFKQGLRAFFKGDAISNERRQQLDALENIQTNLSNYPFDDSLKTQIIKGQILSLVDEVDRPRSELYTHLKPLIPKSTEAESCKTAHKEFLQLQTLHQQFLEQKTVPHSLSQECAVPRIKEFASELADTAQAHQEKRLELMLPTLSDTIRQMGYCEPPLLRTRQNLTEPSQQKAPQDRPGNHTAPSPTKVL